MADQLGDFRCGERTALDIVQSVSFLASTISLAVFTFFTEKLGRKWSFLLSEIICLIGLIIVFYASTISSLTVGVFLTYAGIENAVQYAFCYGS